MPRLIASSIISLPFKGTGNELVGNCRGERLVPGSLHKAEISAKLCENLASGNDILLPVGTSPS